MAFDKEGFQDWLTKLSYPSAPEQYPYYLQIIEEQSQCDLNSLFPDGIDTIDRMMTQEISALKKAGTMDKKDINNLASRLSALRRYKEYCTQKVD